MVTPRIARIGASITAIMLLSAGAALVGRTGNPSGGADFPGPAPSAAVGRIDGPSASRQESKEMFSKLTGVSAAAAVGFSAAVAQGQAVRWRVEDGGNGHWYAGVALESPVPWSIAKGRAEATGGYLVTPTTAEEDAFVRRSFLHDDHLYRPDYACCEGPYLGAYNDGSGWRWVDGSPWG